jgi:hypothetical protein
VSTEERKILEDVLQEFRLLRQAVERIETRLASAPVKAPKKPRQPELSETDAKKLYGKIGEEYACDRTTRKLDELLARSKSDLSLFCSVNHLPVDLHNGKASIRDQIFRPRSLRIPTGFKSFSPGLARSDYPGSSSKTDFNPNGVASSPPEFDATPSE